METPTTKALSTHRELYGMAKRSWSASIINLHASTHSSLSHSVSWPLLQHRLGTTSSLSLIPSAADHCLTTWCTQNQNVTVDQLTLVPNMWEMGERRADSAVVTFGHRSVFIEVWGRKQRQWQLEHSACSFQYTQCKCCLQLECQWMQWTRSQVSEGWELKDKERGVRSKERDEEQGTQWYLLSFHSHSLRLLLPFLPS